jgi:hypothetical protein
MSVQCRVAHGASLQRGCALRLSPPDRAVAAGVKHQGQRVPRLSLNLARGAQRNLWEGKQALRIPRICFSVSFRRCGRQNDLTRASRQKPRAESQA